MCVDGLVVSFKNGMDRRSIFDNAEFRGESGQMDAICGVSGSGKSTFLYVLAGLLSPDAGNVVYPGVENNGKSLLRHHVGFIMQDYGLVGAWGARDNVGLPLRYRKPRLAAAEKDKLITKALEASHFAATDWVSVESLSGGERQRVAIARALVANPQVILADEPTGALDADTTEAVCASLKQIARDGKYVLIATHDPRVAEQCDNVYDLVDGRFVLR